MTSISHGEVLPSNRDNPHIGDQYEVPEYEAHSSFDALKDRIKLHYDLASDYYYSLWGSHIHHGYFTSPTETKEEAQVSLIKLLLEISSLPDKSTVLDVGCGIGGTSRYLAKEYAATVTGITISTRQVEMAKRLTLSESQHDARPAAASNSNTNTDNNAFMPIGTGRVRFLELDAEKMGSFFSSSVPPPSTAFTCVWISEALSHLPNKPLFFQNASTLLAPGGKLVIADWFKSEEVTPAQMESDIKPIEDGMLLPPLHTMAGYVKLAEDAGLTVLGDGPRDISKEVARTWDISWALIQNPSLWAFAISQGRDGLAFLQAFRAMRRGYANGSFRYGVMAFEKPAA